jgi:hypothetical protein
MKFKYLSQTILSCLLSTYSFSLFAISHNSQAWLDFSINEDVPHFEKLSYLLEAQTRFIDQGDHYEFTLFQAGLGYRKTKTLSFWGGYEWIGRNDIYDIPRENHIWEQMVWQPYNNNTFTFRTRTIFEQFNRVGDEQWANFFREKFSLYFPEKFYFKWTPLIYDEIFIKLNDPDWSTTKHFEQNRLFIGLDIPATKTTFFEVGYIQQAIFNSNGNQLNHILYVGFNINPSGLPFAQYVR